MPIYEYECTKCGEIFEAFQKINDRPLKQCRFCQGKVERLISQTSFQLKGSGWYLTDYAKKTQPSSSAETPAKPAEKPAKSGESGSTKKKDD